MFARKYRYYAVMSGILIFMSLILSAASDLIPRELLFANPKYSWVRLSPDGKYVAFLSPDDCGVLNVYVQCVTCKEATPVTFETHNEVKGYYWTGVPNIMLYYNDRDGDENRRLYKINITNPSPSNPVHAINEKPDVMAVVMHVNYGGQDVIINMNDERRSYFNMYKLNLITNEMERILQNRRFSSPVFDNNLQIRLVTGEGANGSLVYYRPADNANLKNLTSEPEDWTEHLRIASEDRAYFLNKPIGFTADNTQVYWNWGVDSDLGQLIVRDFDRPHITRILHNATQAPIFDVTLHPTEHTLVNLVEIYHAAVNYPSDTVREDFTYLSTLRPNVAPYIETISNDFNTWLISFDSSDRPKEYFLYNRRQRKAEFLFTQIPTLAGRQLNQMVGFEFLARDGLRIQAYLCLPPNAPLVTPDQVINNSTLHELAKMNLLPVHPQKLVVLVHEGPQMRDLYGYNVYNSWLTDRDYAVLLVNYRGSSNFGKKFENAGNGEWGGKMQTDLLDGVNFLVDRGVVDRQKIAIMGTSYGGYAALVGATQTPDVFACAVDISGPTDLISLQANIPPQWTKLYQRLVLMLGADGRNEEGREFLKSRSPFFFANQVRKPLLVAHGSNDPRVKQRDPDQLVEALKNHSIPVTYIVFPNSGHVIMNPTLYGFIEEFLHNCLGGKLEPFVYSEYNASAIVKTKPGAS